MVLNVPNDDFKPKTDQILDYFLGKSPQKSDSRDQKWVNHVTQKFEKMDFEEVETFLISINQDLCMFRGELKQNMVSTLDTSVI